MAIRYSLVAPIVVVLFLIRAESTLAQSDIDSEFVDWARSTHHEITTLDMDAPYTDLSVIGERVGNARIVLLGEALHGAAEPLQFRNRLFEYLVEKHGFSAIAIESGITESRVIHDYIRYGEGDLESVVRDGLGWTFDKLPQNASLVRWMREYNENRPASARLDFFGFDVPGSPGNTDASNGPEVAFNVVLDYLNVVDPPSAIEYRDRFSRFLSRLNEYPDFSEAERADLTVAIADLVSLIERRQFQYTAISGEIDYAWAHRSAVGARQLNSAARTRGWLEGDFSRTRAMAENLRWILSRLEPDARVLVFGANGHIATAPRRVSIDPPVDDVNLGMYVRQELPGEVLTIGHSVANGRSGNCGRIPELRLSSPPAASIEARLARIDTPLFILDLRNAPDRVSLWLTEFREHNNGFGSVWYQYSRAMDLIFFSGPVSPACPG